MNEVNRISSHPDPRIWIHVDPSRGFFFCLDGTIEGRRVSLEKLCRALEQMPGIVGLIEGECPSSKMYGPIGSPLA